MRLITSLAVALGLFAIPSMEAHALQTLPEPDGGGAIPEVEPAPDGNGVDVVTSQFTASSPAISIGGSGGFTYAQTYIDDDWRHNVMGTITSFSNKTRVRVTLFDGAEDFNLQNGVYVPDRENGATLVHNLSAGTYTYTSAQGVVAEFTTASVGSVPLYGGEANVTSVTAPNGHEIEYHYTTATVTVSVPNPFGGLPIFKVYTYSRLQSVTNNQGYQVHLEYAGASATTLAQLIDWLDVDRVELINNAVEYCAPTANTCSLSVDWPALDISDPTSTSRVFTDNLNRDTRLTLNGDGRITGIRPPGESSDLVTVSYNTSGNVTSVNTGGLVTSYSRVDASGTRTTTITAPGNIISEVESDLTTGQVTAVENEDGDRTTYAYNSDDLLERVTLPNGQYTEYAYDSRGNMTTVTQVAASGSGLADIVTSATYPASCTNVVTCNLPTSTTDAAGNTTDYTYDSTHGGILTVTPPAPSSGANRPQVRYAYEAKTAYYIQSSGGGVTAASSSIYLPTQSASCRSAAYPGCIGGNNEAVAIIGYGSTGVANNLQPVTMTQERGSGTDSVTTTLSYDDFGNVVQSDGPRTAYDDSTYFRYDALQRLVGTISPDPDGAGSLNRGAVRNTFDTRGRLTTVEYGTVTGTNDTAWNAFSVLDEQEIDYDTLGRTTVTRLISGGATQALRQYSYNAAGQLECVAQRMNPSAYSSLPTSACTLGTAGSYGPDRITRTTYDTIGRVSTVTSAYGTSVAAMEASYTYTDNGQVATLTDGEANQVAYSYDGFSRLIETDFPHPTNPNDDTHISYDAYGRVATHTTRSGQVFTASYDNLNRVTAVTAPSGQASTTFTYDLHNRVVNTISDGRTVKNKWSPLGRLDWQEGPNGRVEYDYDAFGRLNRMTWPDGFYVTYDFNQVGAVTAIRENGASSGLGVLVEFEYDNRGRRTALRRGNGADTTYDYDAASRLEELAQDLPGTTNDQTSTFSYNPAGQITSRVTTNDAWAWDDAANATVNYAVNSLNQITSITGLSAPTYDDRGNMTSDGVRTYGYDYSNRLTSVSGGVSLEYDPLGRLWEVTGSTTRRFQYSGNALIAEYNTSGTLQMRYVHGPGVDEPLVAYTGSGTTTRRWLHADERGSIVAETNHTGSVTQLNAYDEYGAPLSSNSGRFGYTGQVYLEDTGLYHYKARAYNPEIGRFMQTDPIEHAGGMNLYAYVSGDPVNFADPTGLEPEEDDTPRDRTRGGTDNQTPSPEIIVVWGYRWMYGFTGGGSYHNSSLGGLESDDYGGEGCSTDTVSHHQGSAALSSVYGRNIFTQERKVSEAFDLQPRPGHFIQSVSLVFSTGIEGPGAGNFVIETSPGTRVSGWSVGRAGPSISVTTDNWATQGGGDLSSISFLEVIPGQNMAAELESMGWQDLGGRKRLQVTVNAQNPVTVSVFTNELAYCD